MYDFANFVTRRSVHNKIVHYLFDPQHKDGWPKGQWFIRALGFDPQQPKHIRMLEQQVVFDPHNAVFSRKSTWGDRFKQKITVTGPNGKIISGIRAVWQRDKESGIIKILTLLPPKRRAQIHV